MSTHPEISTPASMKSSQMDSSSNKSYEAPEPESNQTPIESSENVEQVYGQTFQYNTNFSEESKGKMV